MKSAKFAPFIKILAMLMALLLLFNGSWSSVKVDGSGSAAVSKSSASSYTSAKSLKVYVRAFVPGNNTPFKSIGHYDLMIKGKITFRGKTFTNPVFSYRMEDSRLDIFNESASGRVYDHAKGDYYHDCDVYQWHIETISAETLAGFLKGLNSIISSSYRHPETSVGIKCRIKSSCSYSRYRAKSTNCYTAVAGWLKSMGDSTLVNFGYAVKEGTYPDYFPSTMVKVFSGKFRKRS